MITTLRAMRSLLKKAAIIGLLALLAGCSSLRLGYGNGPTLAWWWLDRQLGFSAEQAPYVKDALAQWFAWHRATQLPEHVALLAALQAEVEASATTAARLCAFEAQVRRQFEVSFDHMLPLAAAVVPRLGEAQWARLEQRHAKDSANWRAKLAAADAQARAESSSKRAIERAEMLYGRLDDAQRRLLSEGAAAAPYDARIAFGERERRQRATLQTLRRLTAEGAGADIALPALRQLADEFQRSPDGRYRTYLQRMTAHNCELSAQLHNTTTAAQRRAAVARLEGWQSDLRSLIPGPAPDEATATATARAAATAVR
jgi:hypothetical protein